MKLSKAQRRVKRSWPHLFIDGGIRSMYVGINNRTNRKTKNNGAWMQRSVDKIRRRKFSKTQFKNIKLSS